MMLEKFKIILLGNTLEDYWCYQNRQLLDRFHVEPVVFLYLQIVNDVRKVED